MILTAAEDDSMPQPADQTGRPTKISHQHAGAAAGPAMACYCTMASAGSNSPRLRILARQTIGSGSALALSSSV